LRPVRTGTRPEERLLEQSTLGRRVEIPRAHGLERPDFERRHVRGGGRPVIVTDAMNGWPALERWNFDFFRERYGDDQVVANSPMFLERDLGLDPVQVRMSLAAYVDYVRAPEREPRGEFLEGDWAALQRNRIPLYDPAYRILARHPELAADVESSPYFVEDLFARLPEPARRFMDTHGSPVHYLFLAPRGSVSFLHTDYWGTHAYLAQIAGRKLCVLFGPEDDERVYHGAIRNPLATDAGRFPRFAEATSHVGVLERGELIFIPSGWWHFVVGLEPSLTYSYDFFDRNNLDVFFAHFFEAFTRLLGAPEDRLPAGIRAAVVRLHEESKAELARRSGERPGPARSDPAPPPGDERT
jgi:hypothetical protein